MPEPTDAPLPPKYQRFVDEYLVDLNGTRAARDSGFSERSAAGRAVALLKRPEIQAAIERGKRERRERLRLTQDGVVLELARIAHADIGQAFDDKGMLRPLHELGRDELAAMNIDIVTGGTGAQVVKLRYTPQPKVDALKALLAHFEPAAPPSAPGASLSIDVADLAKMTDEDLARAKTNIDSLLASVAEKP